jgi:glutathione S-transferase
MYTLYYYPSNASLAPHMVLEEIGAPYELALVDRSANEHKSARYLKLNPSGLIPVLIDGDLVLTEAAAICLHLADCHPAAGLAPAVGTAERAQLYKWLLYLSNTLQAELISYFYPERLGGGAAETVKANAEARIGKMLDLIEHHLAYGGGPWMLGSHYTIVDPYLLMLARWTRGFAHPARARAALAKFLAAMAGRAAVQRAFAQESLQPPWF